MRSMSLKYLLKTLKQAFPRNVESKRKTLVQEPVYLDLFSKSKSQALTIKS